MSKWDAIGIGLVVRDIFVLLDRYPRADEKLPARELHEAGGGPVPTALVTMARFGRKTAISGLIGNDAVGRNLVDDLNREHVDTSAVATSAHLESPTSVILVENGRRTILEAPGGIGFPLEWADVQKLPLDDCRSLLLDARTVDVQIRAARQVRASSGLVMLDCGHPRDGVDELVSLVDVAIFSHTYPAALYGNGYEPEGFLREVIDRLPTGPAIAGVTLGEKGCALASRDGDYLRVEGVPIDALDTTGAGDVFHGAFLHAFLETGSVERSARFANAAAACKCEGMTGRAPLPDEETLWSRV